MRKGYTLIELLVVIIIMMVLLVGVVVPVSRGIIERNRMRSDAFQLMEDLKNTRNNAIYKQENLNFYFKLNSNEYCFENDLYGYDSKGNEKHYLPTDNVSQSFSKKKLQYSTIVKVVYNNKGMLSDVPQTQGLPGYVTITFRSGSGGSFRGETDLVKSIDTNSSDQQYRLDTSNLNETVPGTNMISYTIDIILLRNNLTYIVEVTPAGSITVTSK